MSYVPRRIDLNRMVPAERAITEAMHLVEGMGASPALTEAVVLLGKARDRVADHVDVEAPKRSPNAILKYFAYEHLPPHLQAVSKPIGDLARAMDEALPDGEEKSAGLRKLLEAKDCFVRTKV